MMQDNEILNPSTISDEIEDNAGMEEIQKAIEEIEQLKNGKVLESDSVNNEDDTLETSTENEPEQEVERVRIPEKNNDKDAHLWQVKKEKYRLLAANEALINEREQMLQMLADAAQNTTYHYGKSAYAELEQTQAALRAAMESGDGDSVVKNIALVSRAQTKVDQLEADLARKSTQQQVADESTPKNSQLYQTILNDWMREHPDCDPHSPVYNPDIASKAATYISNLDQQLVNNGRQDIYLSQPYFDNIDQYLNSIKKQSGRSKAPESASYVGGVRNHHSGSVNGNRINPTKITLTADEKAMCANANISEKEWLKYKIEELNLKGKRA